MHIRPKQKCVRYLLFFFQMCLLFRRMLACHRHLLIFFISIGFSRCYCRLQDWTKTHRRTKFWSVRLNFSLLKHSVVFQCIERVSKRFETQNKRAKKHWRTFSAFFTFFQFSGHSDLKTLILKDLIATRKTTSAHRSNVQYVRFSNKTLASDSFQSSQNFTCLDCILSFFWKVGRKNEQSNKQPHTFIAKLVLKPICPFAG